MDNVADGVAGWWIRSGRRSLAGPGRAGKRIRATGSPRRADPVRIGSAARGLGGSARAARTPTVILSAGHVQAEGEPVYCEPHIPTTRSIAVDP